MTQRIPIVSRPTAAARKSPAAPRPFLWRLGRTLLIAFLAWSVYAVIAANVLYVFRANVNAPRAPFYGMVQFTLPDAWLWALLTPLVFAAARRFPVVGRTWWPNAALHVVLALVIHLVHQVGIWWLHPHVRPGPRPLMPASLYATLLFDVFLYAAMVASVHAVDARRQAMRLRSELLESELRLLRAQLEPHFLFNTLNAVSELVHIDAARADRALARLGDLLRWTIQSSGLHEITLREELAALETYLELQRLRHEDLVFAIAADADTLALAVPGLLLQPLVENAIQHGVRGMPNGRVHIGARRRDGVLAIEVVDNGRGVAADSREGTGLRATRARLEGLYPGTHHFAFRNAPGGGTEVVVEIPARRLHAETGEAVEPVQAVASAEA
jgi:signal transduction histidine kinase